MYRYGYFRNLANELYKVIIITDYQHYHNNLGQGQGEEITLLSQPITIEYEGADDVFAPYRCSTMTVRFLQENFDEALNNTLGNNVFVTLQREEKGKYKTIWQGFSTPQTYNQPFISTVGDTFELECQCALSTLKYCYFEKQQISKHLTIKDYIQLAFLQLNGLFKMCIYPTTPNNFLDICIPQENWFDEDNKPMSWLAILSEICKYLGFTLTTEGQDVLLLDPHSTQYNLFEIQSGRKFPSVKIIEEITLNKEDVSSNDCNISLLPSYNKVSLTAKHYPVEKKIQKYEDMELEHCSGYGEKGQYGASMWNISSGEDSEHVQHFKVGNKQIGDFNTFIRYNHFNSYEDFTFYSHKKDIKGEVSEEQPTVNEAVCDKSFLYSHNVSAPIEYDVQDIKKGEWDAPVKSISLKKAFVFHTAFTNRQNKELFLDTYVTKDDWKAINQTINQVVFSHRIARVTTNDNPHGNIVNVNFNYSCYWGSYMPCKKLQRNDYRVLLYRLRFADKYYNDLTNEWQDTPHNCIVLYEESGKLISTTNTDWKTSLRFEQREGINVVLPTNKTGEVTFEFLRPYTSMKTVVQVEKRNGLFEEKWEEKTRTTEGCNIITDYQATIYGLSQKNNGDDSETVYENTLSDNRFIEEKESIELNVCTYDGKATSYSAPYFYSQERGAEMVRALDYGLYLGTPEENLITREINQLQSPQLQMNISLNKKIDFNSIITSSWFPDKKFIVSAYNFDPQQMNYTYTFVELKDISTFQPIVKKDKNRNQKRNGGLIYHEDNNKPRPVRGNIDNNNDIIKPTNFTLKNNHIIMTI